MKHVFNFVFFALFVAGVKSISFNIPNIPQNSLDFEVIGSKVRQTVQQTASKLGAVRKFLGKMNQGNEKPWFCHDLGCPQYKELNKTKDYELREYAASKWVSTTLENISYDSGVSKMFMKLFEYIEGDNVKKEKVKMTAPVIVKTIAGQGPACKSNFTLSFFVDPNESAPPAPSTKDIFFSSLPKQNVFVKSFGGRADGNRWLKEADALATSLLKDDKKFESGYFYTAGYDSPFRLLDRHNEVWFFSKE